MVASRAARSATGARARSRPGGPTTRNSSSSSSLTTSTAAGIAQGQQLGPDLRRGADIDAHGRLRDDQHLGLRIDLAADDEFLQVAARQTLGRRVGAPRLDLKRSISRVASARVAATSIQPSARSESCRVSSVFAASDSVGTAPRPSRSSGTKCRPSVRAAPGRHARCPGRRAGCCRRWRAGLRRQARRSNSCCPCPTPRRCQHLTGAQLQRDLVQRHAVDTVGGERELLHLERHRTERWLRGAPVAAARRRSSAWTARHCSPGADRPRR